ncbi:MAG: zinc ribbon domain-containing protein [Acidobacteria bacterium]|nr:zinc ribbon domain-containing protein [Acidobacteriota bacterium]
MPIYEYRCESCHTAFEKLRPMREAEQPTDCPRCGNTVAKKELSVCCMSIAGGGGGNSMPAGCGPGGRFT